MLALNLTVNFINDRYMTFFHISSIHSDYYIVLMRRESLLKRLTTTKRKIMPSWHVSFVLFFSSKISVANTVTLVTNYETLYISMKICFSIAFLFFYYSLWIITNNVSYLKLYHVHTVSHRGVT